jgi:hypothetical protein
MRNLIPIAIILLIPYLVVSFVVWNINPSNWTEGNRVVCVIIFTALYAIFVAVNQGIKDR